MEGVHVGFLRHITVQRVVQQKDRNWRRVSAEKVLKKSGTHSLGAYIERRQATVVEWVEFRPILEVYDKNTSYEGRGRSWEPRWQQTAARKQQSDMLKEILVAVREQCWKYVGCGRVKETWT